MTLVQPSFPLGPCAREYCHRGPGAPLSGPVYTPIVISIHLGISSGVDAMFRVEDQIPRGMRNFFLGSPVPRISLSGVLAIVLCWAVFWEY
jgi:hypothetical protein